MRAFVVTASVVLACAACGGSTPPAQSASSDTTALETSGGSSKEAPADSASPASTDAPAAAATPAAASTASSAPSGAAAAADSAPAATFHPAPSVTGAIDGQSFAPKVAQILAPMKKDGRVAITLTEASECPAPGDAKSDHASMTMIVPWQDGYKVDLASLKGIGKKAGDISFKRGKKDATAFKPSGLVTVVSAPMEKGGKGKLKIDLQSGDYMLNGDLDIEVCVSPK
jgi:hypothetical protein